MRAAREEVGAESRDVHVLIRKPVHPVHDQQAAIWAYPAAIGARHDFGDAVDGELHPGGRMHPGHTHRAGFGGDRAADAVRDLADIGGGPAVIQWDIPDARTRARGRIAD